MEKTPKKSPLIWLIFPYFFPLTSHNAVIIMLTYWPVDGVVNSLGFFLISRGDAEIFSSPLQKAELGGL